MPTATRCSACDFRPTASCWPRAAPTSFSRCSKSAAANSCAPSRATRTTCWASPGRATASCWPRPAPTTRSRSGTWPAASSSARSKAFPRKSRRSTSWPTRPTCWPLAAISRFASSARSDGQNVRSLSGSNDFVYASAASADGRTIIAGGQDSVLRSFNADNGQTIRNFDPPPLPAANSAK